MAQSAIRIEIRSLPAYHASGSNIYLAGSFNGWNPQNEAFKFQRDEKEQYYITIKLAPGEYEYKVTRGGWDKVECKKGGAGMENRKLRVESEASFTLDIEEWQDRFPSRPKLSSASKNVRVIDTAFLIPQLKRTRKVWIYLPPDYSSSGKRYPVLYMHDGQNLFDESTAFAGEWGVDEFMDTTMIRKAIVVGVDHGGQKRINEYSPYDMERFGKAEGKEYAAFLVKTLKPYIDKNFRTLKDKKNTFIAGSSMGGLISMYAVIKYPGVFGGVGVFSPAFWVAPKIFSDMKEKGKNVNSKIYFYAGKLEGETMVPDMLKAFEKMAKVSKSKMVSVIRDEGKHNEARWRVEFPAFYEWVSK